MGSIAARRILGESVRVVNTITGLGHAFVSGGIISRLAGVGYSNALAKSDMTIFQNSDDQAMFLGKNWLSKQCARLVPSSGVDTQRFKYLDRTDRDQEVPVIVMLGRLLNQKGLAEFVEVSSRIRELWPKSRFLWAGEEDPIHPDSVSARWMRTREVVEYVGRLSDVLPLLSQADLLLFPSYYREGVPRVVLEAAATGLPTVGFDLPGVREAVQDNETGYLVPFRDVETLTQRVAELLQNKDKRLAMGRAARRMVEKGFDIRVIQEQYFNIYRELGIEV
jgi:glycosyltransferase involved in cell wall biosynthesis